MSKIEPIQITEMHSEDRINLLFGLLEDLEAKGIKVHLERVNELIRLAHMLNELSIQRDSK